MTDKQAIFDQMKELIIQAEKDKAKELATSHIETIDPVELIEKGLAPAMVVVGDKFGKAEMFLPEMMKSAKAFEEVMAVLNPKILESGKEVQKIGIVVIGTVAKDVHEIGKNIVANMLSTGGFEVHDIGYDKSAPDFILKAEEVNADIIAASALMTTTMPYQKDIIDMLESMGKRDKYQVIVGGGAVTQNWADKINADGYAEYAPGAVKLAKELMEKGVHKIEV